MKKFLFLFLSPLLAFAQSVPTPAPKQTKAVVIKNATIHKGTGEVLNNAAIRFENGKITAIGTVDEQNAEVIDIQGKHIYPGLIAPNSQIGLIEIEAARATADFYEVQEFAAAVRSIIAYNTDSKITPTVRSNGILVAQIVPQGDGIAGQSSVVQLDAWSWKDANIMIDNGLHLNWPRLNLSPTKDNPIEDQEKKHKEQTDKFYAIFDKALAYSKIENPNPKDLNLEAMKPFILGQKTVYIQANSKKEILSMLRFVSQYKLNAVLVGGDDAWMLTEELKKQKVAVLLGNVHSLPNRSWEDIQQPFKTPGILFKAGVKVGLYMDGSWNIRNLPFQAGQCVPYGLNKEEALQLITKNNAEILGLDKNIGTLEIGKEAYLIVSEGDVLDMMSSKITYAWIQGRKINLNNHQTDLHDKYKK